MVQFAPPRCKFISLTISCKLWIKYLAPPRFSPLNRVKIQREKLNMHPWRNWQTRMVQVHIFERKCRFNSCRVHHKSSILSGFFHLHLLKNNGRRITFGLKFFVFSFQELSLSLFEYINGFYNPLRPHSHNNGLSPNQAEHYFFIYFSCFFCPLY